MRMSDWSSDVCSSDLGDDREALGGQRVDLLAHDRDVGMRGERRADAGRKAVAIDRERGARGHLVDAAFAHDQRAQAAHLGVEQPDRVALRSEEHTSELQSLMRISYAVFCLKKKKTTNTYNQYHN